MTIEQANQYFAALPDGFASTEQLRAAFTAPVQKVQFVGVAGTAGKTVTARLLAAILREPQYLDLVKDQLTAEQFIQPQQKELYQAMVDCRQQGVDISLATLRAFVSEEALNELSHLAAQYSDVNCTPDDIRLYLDRIARGMPMAGTAPHMSNQELSVYLQSMREKQQGKVPVEELSPSFPSGWSRRGKEQEPCRNCRKRRNWPEHWPRGHATMP